MNSQILSHKNAVSCAFAVLLSTCTIAVDGPDVIDAGKAAQAMTAAALERTYFCSMSTPPPSPNPNIDLQQSLIELFGILGGVFNPYPCIYANEPSQAVRKSDVDACIVMIYGYPCTQVITRYGFDFRTAIVSCPVETIPFLANKTQDPLQGNLLSVNRSHAVFQHCPGQGMFSTPKQKTDYGIFISD